MPDLKYLYHVFYIILNNYSFKQVVDSLKKKRKVDYQESAAIR